MPDPLALPMPLPLEQQSTTSTGALFTTNRRLILIYPVDSISLLVLRVSLLTMATVLRSEGDSEERGRVLSRWVDIAQHCRLVKNFSSLLAVLSGLQSAPVFRLRKAWDCVSR